MDKSIFRIEEINSNFGGIIALNTVSIEVEIGEVLSIIGPNGGGKDLPV